LIRTQGLRVVYGRTVALYALDLSISEGVTGLFGPNGSGKSTLLRALAGLLKPSAGTVTVAGRDPCASSEKGRGRLGYAGHEAGLYARLSLLENLQLFATLYGVEASRADEVIEALGLKDHASRLVVELSAGLKRRAAAARALLHDPDVLLLDEPYANLDDAASELLSSAVRSWRGPAKTAVIATHGAKKVKGWADGGVILRDGRLVSSGRYRPGTGYEADK
jgi:heme exporter protein A